MRYYVANFKSSDGEFECLFGTMGGDYDFDSFTKALEEQGHTNVTECGVKELTEEEFKKRCMEMERRKVEKGIKTLIESWADSLKEEEE